MYVCQYLHPSIHPPLPNFPLPPRAHLERSGHAPARATPSPPRLSRAPPGPPPDPRVPYEDFSQFSSSSTCRTARRSVARRLTARRGGRAAADGFQQQPLPRPSRPQGRGAYSSPPPPPRNPPRRRLRRPPTASRGTCSALLQDAEALEGGGAGCRHVLRAQGRIAGCRGRPSVDGDPSAPPPNGLLSNRELPARATRGSLRERGAPAGHCAEDKRWIVDDERRIVDGAFWN